MTPELSGPKLAARILAFEISSRWKPEGVLPERPILLLVGGLQGSGKTTLIGNLTDDLKAAVISTDEIRQGLFELEVPFGQDFIEAVDEARNALVKAAAEKGLPIVIDMNATPSKIKETEKLLSDRQRARYRIFKVYLGASPEDLRRRVGERLQIKGAYAGTADELEATLGKQAEIDKGAYGLVVDTSITGQEEVYCKVRDWIKEQIVMEN